MAGLAIIPSSGMIIVVVSTKERDATTSADKQSLEESQRQQEAIRTKESLVFERLRTLKSR